MFVVFIVSMLVVKRLCHLYAAAQTGNMLYILLVYTWKMRVQRSLHLLIAATILFSQIVAGVHMAGHMHGPAVAWAATSADSLTKTSLQASHAAHLMASKHETLHQLAYHVTAASDSDEDQISLELSCAIYHIYAGSHCLAENPVVSITSTSLVSVQQTRLPSEPLRPRPEHNTIRGPPVFS